MDNSSESVLQEWSQPLFSALQTYANVDETNGANGETHTQKSLLIASVQADELDSE